MRQGHLQFYFFFLSLEFARVWFVRGLYKKLTLPFNVAPARAHTSALFVQTGLPTWSRLLPPRQSQVHSAAILLSGGRLLLSFNRGGQGPVHRINDVKVRPVGNPAALVLVNA